MFEEKFEKEMHEEDNTIKLMGMVLTGLTVLFFLIANVAHASSFAGM